MKSRMIALSAVTLAAVAGVNLSWAPSTAAAGQAAKVTAPAEFQVDTAHSSLIFKVRHADVAWFYGRFNDVKGTFTLDGDGSDAGAIDLTVKAESVNTGIQKRDDHLRSPDFFSVKEFETITFKSKSVTKTGENTFDATGDFTLHGVTKEITVPVEVTGRAAGRQGGELAGIQATFTIKRSDYGMDFMVDRGLGDEVTIIASLEGKSAK